MEEIERTRWEWIGHHVGADYLKVGEVDLTKNRSSMSTAVTRPSTPTWSHNQRAIDPRPAPSSRQRHPRSAPTPLSRRAVTGS